MATDYGRDTSCTAELTPGYLVTGAKLVAQAVFRRLITPRGVLRGGEDEANFGLELSAEVGRLDSAQKRAALPSKIRSEILKDERVSDCDVELAATTNGPAAAYTITIRATLVTEQEFNLVLAVSDVTTEILRLEST